MNIQLTQQLIDRYLDGVTTPEEEQTLARMLSADDIPDEWKPVSVMLGQLAMDEAAYDQIIAQRQAAQPTRRRWTLAVRSVAAVAASLLLLLGLSHLWQQHSNSKSTSEIAEQIAPAASVDTTSNIASRTHQVEQLMASTTEKPTTPAKKATAVKRHTPTAATTSQATAEEEADKEWIEQMERYFDEYFSQFEALDKDYNEIAAAEKKAEAEAEIMMQWILLEEEANEMMQQDMASRFIVL